MNRGEKVGWLVSSLAVATVLVLTATLGALGALAKIVDPHHYCETGFSKWVDCSYHWSSRTIGQGNPIFGSTSPRPFQPSYTDTTSWAIVECPQNETARRWLCATSNVTRAEAASDDLTSELPRPKPWFITTGRNSRFIRTVHVETPLAVAATLDFYRAALSRRGWTENDGAVVAPDEAVVAFTTADGPAVLRLARHGDRTMVDLSLRKPVPASAGIPSTPGQTRLLLGNATKEDAVITINGQTIKLAAQTGVELTENPETVRKSKDSREIDLPPGRYEVTLRIASGAVQHRALDVVADETWGLVVGPDAVPLPLRLN